MVKTGYWETFSPCWYMFMPGVEDGGVEEGPVEGVVIEEWLPDIESGDE